MKEGIHRRGQLTRASALALVLVAAACGYPRTRTNLADRRAADVRSAAVEVVDGSRHGLAGPRQGTLETLARAAAHSPSPFVSAVTAFSVAAEAALRARGIRVEPKYGAAAVLRITLVEFEVHDEDAAGLSAFVSATYALLTPDGVSLWTVDQHRLPFRLAGLYLTDSQLARMAEQSVDVGLASLPASHPHT